MDPIDEIIKYINRTRYEDLPQKAIEVTKKAIIDTVGAGIAGSSAPLGKLVARMVKGYGGEKQSTVLVNGDKVPTQEAAFTNAIMARCRELDDVHEGNKRCGGGNGGHVSVTIIPATLAMLESSPNPVSGDKLILSIAIGSDVLVRLRLASGEKGRLGWMTETLSPFSIVASAAKLFDLGEEAIANAMGAAYVFCSGNALSTSDGTWDIWLAAGTGARGGVVAVDMAQRGYLGSKSPLLGRFGLYPLYFQNNYNEKILLGDLGNEFESANLSIKPYSSCKGTHHAIYTTLKLVKKHSIKPEQIEHIKIKTCSYFVQIVVLNEEGEPKYAPRTVTEAQFSIPFTVATAIIKGGVFPDVLTEEVLKDSRILGLSRKVAVEATAEKDEIMKTEGIPPADVEIYTKDGSVYSGCEPFVKGHPQNPMSFKECADKFWRCTKLSNRPLNEKKLKNFLGRAERLEEILDVRSIISDLA